ncbi:MAG: 4-deoxy-4-formamido-L-arabinose-phosphoundecaprenol deformylase [Desulfobacterales bacterium]|nr:4-deoxy-4-formamido-L-arabinose-phosphoundecaprenol deformylase [Desulfobacterales bacterium]
MKIGLRIDVDTFRGTKHGVLSLCKLFKEYDISASFFFSVGPDNMGRHIFRLIKRPSFFKKMLRTKAQSLYGWDIIFKGTIFPGPIIGEKLKQIIIETNNLNHEIGLHAWDHHMWQTKIDNMSVDEVHKEIYRGFKSLSKILGYMPACSASPGWKCNKNVLIAKSNFPFIYNTDCRGSSIFYPIIDGITLSQPQIPTTLPTYDEIVDNKNITNENYNQFLLSLLKPNGLNVLTIHAEVEGISCIKLFERFITMALKKGFIFTPLKTLLTDKNINISSSTIYSKEIYGREGEISFQQ